MPSILVIDDNDSFRSTICLWLKHHGYEVKQAANGKDAMAMLAPPPDVILTDILMPEQDGLETIQAVRKQSPAMKIIAMSGGMLDGRVDFLPLAEKFGADHVMHKPFSGSELLLVLENMFGTPPAK